MGPPPSLEALKRSLRLYKVLALALAVALLLLLVGLRRAMVMATEEGEEPPVEVFDVQARFEAISRERSDVADFSQTYFFSDSATVHMHVMGRGQTCPLHLHRKTHEATVIVAGQAEVHQRWGAGGAFTERKGTHAPGELIASPPLTGHAWFNRAEDRMLGNLVFATPPFDGNLYVEPQNPQMLAGAAPFTFAPSEALKAFTTASGPILEEPLPVLQGQMASVLLKDSYALVATRQAPIILYVAEGTGTLEARKSNPVQPGQLWVLRRGVQLHAETPLALYVFRPPPATLAP
jgi:hypothetical protein